MNPLGFLSGLASAIFISISSITAKEAMRTEHSITYLLFSSLVVVVLFVPFLGYVHFGLPLILFVQIYFSSLFGTVGLLFAARALRHLDISVVTPFLNVSIVFTVAFGAVFLGEYLTPLALLGAALVVAGGYLLEIRHGRVDWWRPLEEFVRSRYLHFVFGAALFYAASAVLDRVILQTADIVSFLFFADLFLLVNLIVWYLLASRESFAQSFAEVRASWGWAITSAVTRLVSSFFYAFAVSVIFVGLAVALKRLSTLFSVLLGGKFFHERFLGWRFFASLIMVMGAVLMIF